MFINHSKSLQSLHIYIYMYFQMMINLANCECRQTKVEKRNTNQLLTQTSPNLWQLRTPYLSGQLVAINDNFLEGKGGCNNIQTICLV